MVSPATRAVTARLTDLLAREHQALAEFILELAAFDRDALWQEYGHTSLYDFLVRELRLAKGSAYLRQVAARLVQRYPEVADALRAGRLCISSVAELSKVINDENRAEVLPRFFHCSKKEAQVLSAELRPLESPPMRAVVTALPLVSAPSAPEPATIDRGSQPESWHRGSPPDGNPPPTREQPAAQPAPPPEVVPVTADLRRLHLTVSQRLLDKVARVQALRSHRPGETLEQTLEAALDLLLEGEDRKKALVRNPRPAPPPRPDPEPGRRDSRHIPAAVKREVWLRDGGRCQFRLESGELCGSTHQVEFHHLQAHADGGVARSEDLSLRCGPHHRAESERAFGDGLVEHCRERRRGRREQGAARPRQVELLSACSASRS